MSETALLWLRNDLRLTDHATWQWATDHKVAIIPVYIHAPEEATPWIPGSASQWWLHHSLQHLQRDLELRGGRLIVRRGASAETLLSLARETRATCVCWQRSHEPALRKRDEHLAHTLRTAGIACRVERGALLHEPAKLLKNDGTPYRVFTPFFRAWEKQLTLGMPTPAPTTLSPITNSLPSLHLDELQLVAPHPWQQKLTRHWQPGEQSALDRLALVAPSIASSYERNRDFPAIDGTARFSAALHFGELSPKQVYWALLHSDNDPEKSHALRRQLVWREFAHYVLWHYPHTSDEPMDIRFKQFPWRSNANHLLQAWQLGRTGIPIVDAGMRQLWASGWMHNRVRMIAASFLTKHCRIPWQEGARWFWETLVDADLANNSMGWQWVAGCGVDAAPYFRVFSPLRQSEKFDAAGDYIARWLPELAPLPAACRHAPWLTPEKIAAQIDFRLGRDYPAPIVDLEHERKAALEAYKSIRTN